MEEAHKDRMMIRMVGGWMFLLVPAHPGSPGQRAIKRLLLLLSLLWHCWLGIRKSIQPIRNGVMWFWH